MFLDKLSSSHVLLGYNIITPKAKSGFEPAIKYTLLTDDTHRNRKM